MASEAPHAKGHHDLCLAEVQGELVSRSLEWGYEGV
jgi:hypothetical protein